MGIATRGRFLGSNLVERSDWPNLPIPVTYGQVTWSCGFEESPTAQIEYRGIPRRDLSRYDNAYPFRREISISGFRFRVKQKGYSEDRFIYQDDPYGIYSFRVSLEGLWVDKLNQAVKVSGIKDGAGKISPSIVAQRVGISYVGPYFAVEPSGDEVTLGDLLTANARRFGCILYHHANGVGLRPLNGGRSWSFSELEIIDQNEANLERLPVYKNTELRFKQLTIDSNPDNSNLPPSPREPQIQILIEEDESPETPPPNTFVLQTLDSAFDVSGPKKTRKKTTIVDGNTTMEEYWIWGFAYTAADIYNNALAKLYSFTPEDFWMVVEYRRSVPLLQSLSSAIFSNRAIDPRGDNRAAYLALNPDFSDFSGNLTFSGQTVFFDAKHQYVIGNSETGWRLARPYKDEGTDSSNWWSRALLDDPIEAAKNAAAQFRPIPITAQSRNLLKSIRENYKESSSSIGVPFAVEWVLKGEADPRIQEQFAFVPDDTLIGVVTPDRNFKEPLYIEIESSASSAFLAEQHPEYSNDQPEAPLITGEESYARSDRLILKNESTTGAELTYEKYRERSIQDSSQESGFGTSFQQAKFKEVLGRPPEAQIWQTPSPEDVQQQPKQQLPTNNPRYYITSDNTDTDDIPGGSVDYPTAENINEAMTAAMTDLRIEGMRVRQANRQVISHLPEMRPGDTISVGGDYFSRIDGSWRVYNVSWSLEFNGFNDMLGRIEVRTGGTQMTLARDVIRSLNLYTQTNGVDVPTSGNVQGILITDVTYTGSSTLGEVAPDVTNRRNFG